MKQFIAFVTLCVAMPVMAETINAEQLKVYGGENQKTVYVFTSPACPHCATFHDKILPQLKKETADKGLAQIKLVEMATDNRSLKVAQLGRCMSMPQYEKYMNLIYKNQSDWAYGKDPEGLIKGYAEKAGLNPVSVKRCWDNQELADTITEQWQNLAQQYRISGMPTTVLAQGVKKQTYVGADKRIIKQIKNDLKAK